MKARLREMSDEELMVLYQEGDESAFEILYSRYSSKIYGYLRNRLAGRQLVDDVFQATFSKLHRSREQFDPRLKFAPWLFTVCRTVMLDNLRAEGRRESHLEDPREDERVVAAPMAEENEKAGSVLANLQTLTDGQRRAIEMRYIEELSFEEIAIRLNKSPANVRQLVSRGIRQLQGMFGLRRGSE